MVKILIDIGKVIKFTVLTALILSALSACQKDEDTSMKSNISIKVVQLILEHSELQQYFHPDKENRLPVRVVTNNLIPTNITINKFDKPVLFLSEAPSHPYLEIITFKHNSDTIEFFIRYDVEGIGISGKASIEKSQVSLIVFDVVEG